MGFQFEFDRVNKILLTRLNGELTDDLIRKVDAGMRHHLTNKSPNVHVVECSAVTKYSMSPESVRHLAKRDPALQGIDRFFVMPSTVGVGMARMFQISGDPNYNSVAIVSSLNEVFTALAIDPPKFEVLE